MLVPRVLPYGQVRTIQLCAVFGLITLLLFVTRLCTRQPPHSIYDFTEGRTNPWHEWNDTAPAPSSEEVAYLRYLQEAYGLTNDVPWFARRIQSSHRAGKRLSMTELSSKFMPHDFARVRVDDENLKLKVDASSLKLPFHVSAKPDQIDASGLLIGISTTYSRLSYSNFSLAGDWARWLTDGRGRSNGASLFLDLHRANKEEKTRTARILREAGIDATVLTSDSAADATARYGDLIRYLKSHNEELMSEAGGGSGGGKKFFALLDDNVFIASMDKLVTKLSSFGSKKEYYIGAPSEKQSDWVVDENVTMTYGGGAVFFTPPMADRLARLPCLRQAAATEAVAAQQWDERIYRCVTENTRSTFYVLPSFYSPQDEALYGARSVANQGYGGGIQPITLHHYRNLHRFGAADGHRVTSVCGEECFLQRFHFRDNWVLVNGYTLSHYPDGVSAIPVRKNAKMVSQFRGDAAAAAAANKRTELGGNIVIDNADRPADMKLIAWAGPKRTWRLLHSKTTPSGEVWQAYVKRRGAAVSYGDIDDDRMPGDPIHTDEGPSNEDSVIVLIWQP